MHIPGCSFDTFSQRDVQPSHIHKRNRPFHGKQESGIQKV
jgi:hypothetical protein